MPDPASNRRDFLTGRALRKQAEQAGQELADALARAAEEENAPAPPVGGDTIHLGTRAMACDFAVVLNADRRDQITDASDALEIIHACEQQMTVYRDDSALSQLNRRAAGEAVEVEESLYSVLSRARSISVETAGAFDPTSGPLIALWGRCRKEGRTPSEEELAECMRKIGVAHLDFDDERSTIRYLRDDVELNLGGIGKGDALDRAAALLEDRGVGDFLFHGGHSSLLARGDHNATGGWPVGLRNPLFPEETFATILLQDRAMSSSGSGVQHFRLEGKRYGHILDPRSGWPVEGILSVTVTAPTAAEADALSTAFFVLGVENTLRYCDNRKDVGVMLLPLPERGRRLDPVVANLADDVLYLMS